MANFANPTVGSNYTDFPNEIRASVNAALRQLSVDSHTNIPTGAIKFDTSANRWKKFNGSAFVDLTSTYNLNANVSVNQLDLGNDERARFGGSQELQIYNDGSRSRIESNSDHLFIKGGDITFFKGGSSEQFIDCNSDGSVDLFFNQNVHSDPKLSTTNYGIQVTNSVGIGRAAGRALDVEGSVQIGTASTAGAELTIGRSGSGNRNAFVDFIGDDTYTDHGLRIIRRNTGANAASEIIHRGTGTLSIVSFDAGALEFRTNNTPRVYVHPTLTRVGIGLTSPSARLHVQGTGTAEQLLTLHANLGSNNRNMQILTPAADDLNEPFKFVTGNSFAFRIDSTDCLKIGSDDDVRIPNDTSKLKLGTGDDLQIYHNGTNSVLQNNTGNLFLAGDDIRLSNNAINELFIHCDGDNGGAGVGNVNLYFDNDRHFRTISSGCQVENTTGDAFLIIHAEEDATTADSILRLLVTNSDANSIIQFGDNNDTNVGQIIYGHGSGTSDGDDMTFRTNDAEQMRLDWDGNDARLAVGNTSPSAKFHVTDDQAISTRLHRTSANNSGMQFSNATSSIYAGMAGNALGFVVNVSSSNLSNSPAFFVSRSDEQIGIGTTSPTAAVHISSSGSGATAGLFIEDSSNSSTSPFLHIRGKRSDSNDSFSFGGQVYLSCNRTDTKIDSGKKLGTILFGGNHTDSSTSNELFAAMISGVAADNFDSATDMPTDLVFFTGNVGRSKNATNVTAGTERLRIKNDGKIGIGKSDPAGQLHISSGDSGDCVLVIEADEDNNNEGDNTRIEFKQDGGSSQSAIGTDNNELVLSNSVSTGGGIVLKTGSSSGFANATERFRITSAGVAQLSDVIRTGKGTQALPAYSFTADTNTGIFSHGSGNSGRLGISCNNSLSTLFFGDGFSVGTGTTETNIGMGDNTETGFVVGADGERVRISSSNEGHFLVINSETDSSSNTFTSYRLSGEVIGRITQNTSSSVTYHTTSDKRLKENIVDIKDALLTLLKLKPKQYNWKKDKNKESEHGFIAQDLLEANVCNYAVGYDKEEDYYGLDYSRLVTIAIAAIQELSGKVSELETKVG